MKKRIAKFFARHDPVCWLLEFGLALAGAVLLISLHLLATPPETFPAVCRHYHSIQILIATAIALPLQAIAGAWILHMVRQSKR